MKRMRALVAIAMLLALASAHASGLPELASVNATVVDVETGAVVLEKHADAAVPIASITKLMTALVVVESGAPLDEWLTVLDWQPAPPNNAFSRIRVGSTARRADLLQIALMASENRAAHQLARHHPGGFDAFVAAMNHRARELGMTRSTFVEPTGLATGNMSSAADLARLLLAARQQPLLREYSTSTWHEVQFRQPRYRLAYGNTNPLTRSSRWDVELTKTGYLDAAGRCLVMVANVDGRELAMVLLNSFGKRSPLGDAGRIRRWLANGEIGTIHPAARAYEQRASGIGQGAQ